VVIIFLVQLLVGTQEFSVGNILIPFLLVLVLIIAAFAALGWQIRRSTLPIDEMQEASEKLAAGDYSVRVRIHGPPEIRTVIQAFNDMAARLQEHEEQRRDFFADVTHEIRTPLTVIQGNLEGMLDGVYGTDDSHLQSMLYEVTHLSHLVEDLRVLSLLESGRLTLHKESTDLPTLMHETAAAFLPQAEISGITINVDASDEFPLVQLDPIRIREVLINLISNALRYVTSGGSITLDCSEVSEDRIQIFVIDTGCGISPEELPHVFERFSRSPESTGTGLGLPITKKFVEAHDGTISITSILGEGTSVEIRLPA
jgi:two-component system sensor histidine kinase BaeS